MIPDTGLPARIPGRIAAMFAAASVIVGLGASSGAVLAQTTPPPLPANDRALIAAAAKGDFDGVTRALQAGGSVTARDAQGRTALLEAIILGDGGARHTEIVRMLVAAKADVYLADNDGVTPLVHARRRGFAGMIKILEAAGSQ